MKRLLMALCFAASMAFADAELVLDSFAFIEQPIDGQIVKQPVEFVDPGDILLMEVVVTNVGSSPANNFEVTNPVPEIAQLYELPPAQYDPFVGNRNGQYFPIDQLQGQRLDQLTSVRWKVPFLAAGERMTLTFRVRVNSD